MKGTKKQPPIIEKALNIICEHDPFSFDMTFEKAIMLFALSKPMLETYCAGLPVDDEYNLEQQKRNNPRFRYIRFNDVWNLVKSRPGGLKAAMHRRHKTEAKTLDLAKKTISTIKPFKFMTLKMQVAVVCMTNRLKMLTGMEFNSFIRLSTKRKRTDEETKLVAGIRAIAKLKKAFLSMKTNLLYLQDAISPGTKTPNAVRIKFHIDVVNKKKPLLIKRYKAHSAKYAPQIMTLPA